MDAFVNSTSAKHKNNRVLLIYTGGTIGMGKILSQVCLNLLT